MLFFMILFAFLTVVNQAQIQGTLGPSQDFSATLICILFIVLLYSFFKYTCQYDELFGVIYPINNKRQSFPMNVKGKVKT